MIEKFFNYLRASPFTSPHAPFAPCNVGVLPATQLYVGRQEGGMSDSESEDRY